MPSSTDNSTRLSSTSATSAASAKGLLNKTAPVTEIFTSIQGEGPYVGVNQIFVRFSHCHLKCQYCDTPMQSSNGQCHIYGQPGSKTITQQLANPLTPATLINTLGTLAQQSYYHSVSFTGGEPLLYHALLAQVFAAIQNLGLKTYLETSGTQPEFLATVLPHTDIIAMDIKLPSATGERDYFAEHHQFMALASSTPQCDLYAKVVINNHITQDELQSIITVMQPYPNTLLVIQPESQPDGRTSLTSHTLFKVQHTLLSAGIQVRVIPQTHKQLAIQ